MGPAKVLFVLLYSGFIFSLVTHPKSAILIWMRRMEGSIFLGAFSPKKWHQIYGDLNLISNKGCKYRLTWESSHGSNNEKRLFGAYLDRMLLLMIAAKIGGYFLIPPEPVQNPRPNQHNFESPPNVPNFSGTTPTNNQPCTPRGAPFQRNLWQLQPKLIPNSKRISFCRTKIHASPEANFTAVRRIEQSSFLWKST